MLQPNLWPTQKATDACGQCSYFLKILQETCTIKIWHFPHFWRGNYTLWWIYYFRCVMHNCPYNRAKFHQNSLERNGKLWFRHIVLVAAAKVTVQIMMSSQTENTRFVEKKNEKMQIPCPFYDFLSSFHNSFFQSVNSCCLHMAGTCQSGT